MKKIITAKEQFVKDLESIGYYYSEPTVVTSEEKFWLTIDDGNIYLMFEMPKNLYFRYEYGRFSTVIEFYKSTKTIKGLVRYLTDKEDFSSIRAFMLALNDNGTGRLEQFLPDIKQSNLETKTITYIDKEVEVSTEEIEAIRKEIAERCKGHSIEEIRDMFEGFNKDILEGGFDFYYKGFGFTIYREDTPNREEKWYLAGRMTYTNDSFYDETEVEEIALPIPPKKINVDVETKKVVYEDSLIANLSAMVLHVSAMANLEIQRRWDAGQNFTEDDMGGWNKDYFNDLEVYENKFTLKNNEDGILCLASNWRNDEGYEYFDTLDTVPVDELLYILKMMH